MDDYAYVNGKKLRKGFTTGTCATTATAAAYVNMILNQDIEEKFTVSTANGVEVMDIKDPSLVNLLPVPLSRKDGGDDADATHGLYLFDGDSLAGFKRH